MRILRLPILAAGLLPLWQLVVIATGLPRFILPDPIPVGLAIASHWPSLQGHLLTTFTEIVLGLVIGTLLGALCALSTFLLPLVKRWLLTVLVVSQAIPVFALAPILVLWLGYGWHQKLPWRFL